MRKGSVFGLTYFYSFASSHLTNAMKFWSVRKIPDIDSMSFSFMIVFMKGLTMKSRNSGDPEFCFHFQISFGEKSLS